MRYYAPHLRDNARSLRKNMTKEGRRLWYGFLKQLPVTVKRQELIGRYIADFYIPSHRIAIELDGTQHFEDSGAAYDKIRDEFFNGEGIAVLRYPNNAVNQNFSGVCEDILRRLELCSETKEETGR